MKTTMLFLLLSMFFLLPESGQANNYEEGQTLTVFAHSGLRLRMAPSDQAKTLRIMPFGSKVIVKNTFGFDRDHHARKGWLEGHWILVSYDGIDGYVFDLYLSTLDAPDHENQLCIDCVHLILPFENYVLSHHPGGTTMKGPDHSALSSQYITYADSMVQIIRTNGEKWYHVEFVFENTRLSEVLNIFRSLIVEERDKNDFEESLLFRKNQGGDIHAIEIRMYETPINMKKHRDGTVHVESIVFYDQDGC